MIGVNTCSRCIDGDTGAIGGLPNIGEAFPIGEEMDGGATVQEDPVWVDDEWITLLKLDQYSAVVAV